MKISLIGMSNVGKTYWSKKLEEKGFLRFSCDEYIQNILGYTEIESISEWLGQPYDKQHKSNSPRYLDLERESLEYFFDQLEKMHSEGVVIDTTGSVIHIENNLIRRLSKYTTIVYLDTPLSVREELYKSYLKHPKPVIWGNHFHFMNGESKHDALARCYHRLLDYRIREYKKHAHVSLNYFLLRQKDFSVDSFINLFFNLENKI